jgi:hypothetical protein
MVSDALTSPLALAAATLVLATLYVIGERRTKSAAGKVDLGTRPLDFFKSLLWVSTAGHVLGGFAVVFLACVYGGSRVAGWTALGLGILAVAKETADVFWESDEDWFSSLEDLCGWLFGIVIAWANILCAMRLGKL